MLVVTALLELSGPRGSLGSAQRDALQLASEQHGAQSPKLRLKVVDVGGGEGRLLVELRRAAMEDRADAVIVGTAVTPWPPALLDAVELAATPVLLTMPAVEPPPGGGRWLFALAPTPARIDAIIAADLAARGIVEVPVRLGPRAADSVTGPLALAGATAVVLSGGPKEYPKLPAVLRATVPAPVVYLGYGTDPAELGEFRELAATVVWPGSLRLVGGALADQGAARRDFVRALTERRGPPPTVAGSAFDALALLLGAADQGVAGRAALRDRLEAARQVGLATTYSFGPARHAGGGGEDFGLLRFAGAVVAARAPERPEP